MNKRIQEIETYSNYSNTITFAGTLRNQYKFEMHQVIFIKSGDKMVQCKIVGIELPPSENPDYIYKVEIPKEFVDEDKSTKSNRVSLICSHIFESIEDAKKSAIKEIEMKFKLNVESINRYFEQYENKGELNI